MRAHFVRLFGIARVLGAGDRGSWTSPSWRERFDTDYGQVLITYAGYVLFYLVHIDSYGSMVQWFK